MRRDVRCICPINGGLWRQIEQGDLTLPELEQIRWNHVFDALGMQGDGVAFEAYFKRGLYSSALLEPYALELVRDLAASYTLCAASNGPYEQQVNRLRVAGLLDGFSHVFVSSRMRAEKPSTRFFDACFEVLRRSDLPDLRPEEAMIVGDSLTSDIAGGARYGMRTCLFRKEPVVGLLDPTPDFVVSSLTDVCHIL